MQLAIMLTQEETEILEDGEDNSEYTRTRERVLKLYNKYNIDFPGIPILGKDDDGELYDTCSNIIIDS